MGGHGGLNILPQKRWNVYNYENREKVRLDEESAAREEQLKQEQSRKRDAEFRLERLRQARGIHHQDAAQPSTADEPIQPSTADEPSPSDSKHINLFEGLKIFPAFGEVEEESNTVRRNAQKKQKREERDAAAAKVVLPEDEKYRLAYGLAGKGVKAPWYLSRPSDGADAAARDGDAAASGSERGDSGKKSGGKKTLEELREERMKRERREKERERALFLGKNGRDGSAKRSRLSRFPLEMYIYNVDF